MGFRDLTDDEIATVLERERTIRLCFRDGDEMFLVPVFFVAHGGDLFGLTAPGRKTRMGAVNPKVAFQVDSTSATGDFEWASVSGEGTWSEVTDPAGMMAWLPQMQQKLADSPEWAQQLLAQRLASLGRFAWRITPSVVSGRAHGPG